MADASSQVEPAGRSSVVLTDKTTGTLEMPSDSLLQILIVEDSATSAQLLLIQLEECLSRPFNPLRATTLAEAHVVMSQHRVDIVLLDLNLPDSLGLDTFTRLHAAHSRVPIVILSGVSEESVAIEAVRGGAQDYLVKSRLDEGNQINRAIQFSLERFERERVDNELSGAQHVQAGLYPKAAPSIPNFDIAGKALPAEKCSGDYFDFIPMKDDQLGIVVGDVSGHGLGPALRMAETRATLHTLAKSWDSMHDSEVIHDDLSTILGRANAVLNSADGGQFVTLFFAKFEPGSCSFTYAGAGHRAFLIRANGDCEVLPSSGLALGLIRDFDITESPRITMLPGDTLFVPTDGIEETQTSEQELFGKQRMLEHLASGNGNSAEMVLDSLFNAARNFASDYPQQDDMTAVLVRRRT